MFLGSIERNWTCSIIKVTPNRVGVSIHVKMAHLVLSTAIHVAIWEVLSNDNVIHSLVAFIISFVRLQHSTTWLNTVWNISKLLLLLKVFYCRGLYKTTWLLLFFKNIFVSLNLFVKSFPVQTTISFTQYFHNMDNCQGDLALWHSPSSFEIRIDEIYNEMDWNQWFYSHKRRIRGAFTHSGCPASGPAARQWPLLHAMWYSIQPSDFAHVQHIRYFFLLHLSILPDTNNSHHTFYWGQKNERSRWTECESKIKWIIQNGSRQE